MYRQYDDLMPLQDALEHVVLCVSPDQREIEQSDAQTVCLVQADSNVPDHEWVQHDGSD